MAKNRLISLIVPLFSFVTGVFALNWPQEVPVVEKYKATEIPYPNKEISASGKAKFAREVYVFSTPSQKILTPDYVVDALELNDKPIYTGLGLKSVIGSSDLRDQNVLFLSLSHIPTGDLANAGLQSPDFIRLTEADANMTLEVPGLFSKELKFKPGKSKSVPLEVQFILSKEEAQQMLLSRISPKIWITYEHWVEKDEREMQLFDRSVSELFVKAKNDIRQQVENQFPQLKSQSFLVAFAGSEVKRWTDIYFSTTATHDTELKVNSKLDRNVLNEAIKRGFESFASKANTLTTNKSLVFAIGRQFQCLMTKEALDKLSHVDITSRDAWYSNVAKSEGLQQKGSATIPIEGVPVQFSGAMDWSKASSEIKSGFDELLQKYDGNMISVNGIQFDESGTVAAKDVNTRNLVYDTVVDTVKVMTTVVYDLKPCEIIISIYACNFQTDELTAACGNPANLQFGDPGAKAEYEFQFEAQDSHLFVQGGNSPPKSKPIFLGVIDPQQQSGWLSQSVFDHLRITARSANGTHPTPSRLELVDLEKHKGEDYSPMGLLKFSREIAGVENHSPSNGSPRSGNSTCIHHHGFSVFATAQIK